MTRNGHIAKDINMGSKYWYVTKYGGTQVDLENNKEESQFNL